MTPSEGKFIGRARDEGGRVYEFEFRPVYVSDDARSFAGCQKLWANHLERWPAPTTLLSITYRPTAPPVYRRLEAEWRRQYPQLAALYDATLVALDVDGPRRDD